MVVSVDDHDFKTFEKDGELRALRFQESVEKKAFQAGGENLSAPAQRVLISSTEKPPLPYPIVHTFPE
jgi:uncharacterized protein